MESNAQPGAVTYLVGAKLDREASRTVSKEEGEKLAGERGAVGWCEVSAKTRENVRRPFVECVGEIVKRPELMRNKGGRGTVSVAGGHTIKKTDELAATTAPPPKAMRNRQLYPQCHGHRAHDL